MLGKRLSLVLITLLFSLAVSYARAEMRTGLELGLFGGSVTANAGIQQNVDGGHRIATNITNGNIYGLRVGGNFNSNFGIEIAIADAGTRYNAYLFDAGGTERSSEENTSIGLININALLQFPIGRIVPFVTVGTGKSMFIDYNLSTTNYGAGVKIFLTRNVFLRADFKKYIVNGDHELEEIVDIRNGIYYVVPYAFSDQIQLKEISLGISILF
ncbi:MAG: outer membrane beta-barrel protein [Nitrospirae bacterium]|nr:outer membrane beta-barrel protein [Nitrospirota bacterium]